MFKEDTELRNGHQDLPEDGPEVEGSVGPEVVGGAGVVTNGVVSVG